MDLSIFFFYVVKSFEKQATGLLALVLGTRVNNHTSLKKMTLKWKQESSPFTTGQKAFHDYDAVILYLPCVLNLIFFCNLNARQEFANVAEVQDKAAVVTEYCGFT